METVTKKGVPELYYSNSTKYNDNTPLGWSESLFIVALHDVNENALKRRPDRGFNSRCRIRLA